MIDMPPWTSFFAFLKAISDSKTFHRPTRIPKMSWALPGAVVRSKGRSAELARVPARPPVVSLSKQILHGKLSRAERISAGIISFWSCSPEWVRPRADNGGGSLKWFIR